MQAFTHIHHTSSSSSSPEGTILVLVVAALVFAGVRTSRVLRSGGSFNDVVASFKTLNLGNLQVNKAFLGSTRNLLHGGETVPLLIDKPVLVGPPVGVAPPPLGTVPPPLPAVDVPVQAPEPPAASDPVPAAPAPFAPPAVPSQPTAPATAVPTMTILPSR